MDIGFLHPAFLWLLPLAALPWFLPRPSWRGRKSGWQVPLRAAVLFVILIALARPVLLTGAAVDYQVLILDRSGSLTAQQRKQSEELLGKWLDLAPRDSTVVIIGDRDTPLEPVLENRPAVVRVDAGASGSPLGAALSAAEREIPWSSSGLVTLISDGLATDRHWGPSVQRLTRRGIAVDTYDLGAARSDLYLAGIEGGDVMRAGQTASIGVDVIGAASGVQVSLSDAAGHLLAQSSPLDSAGRLSVELKFEPAEAGFLPVTARVSAAGGDADASNNTLQTTLAIQSPIPVLYVGERMEQGAARLAHLLGGGFRITDGSAMPLEGIDLGSYELVVLDDRPASRVPAAFQQALIAAIRDRGLGLIFSGGKAAFGTGGYEDSLLADSLPVDFTQRTEKRDPSTALALIIDTSSSMSGGRIEMAKQVARLAIRRLKAHDRVGIVEFYGNKHWALPMQSAANKITIDRAIGRMQAVGGTVLYPAIEEAYYGLKNMNTRYKHILILTDAGFEDADYESLVRMATEDRIAISTVLMGSGDGDAQNLVDIATWGKGHFYSAADRYALPEVLLKQPSTMKLPAYKSGSFPVLSRGGEGWWTEIDRGHIPMLAGYVETRVRPGAEVLMEVRDSAHPVLASWFQGLGRVTALMTEPVGEGTRSWQDWKDYGRWLARVASLTAEQTQPFRYDIERQGDRVVLEARRRTRSDSLPRASVLSEDGRESGALQFSRLTPEHFVAEQMASPGSEVRFAAGGDGAHPEALLVSTAAADTAPERQVDPALGMNLRALAQATQGAYIDVALGAAPVDFGGAREVQGAVSFFRLWPFALLLALLMYVAELVCRRWSRQSP